MSAVITCLEELLHELVNTKELYERGCTSIQSVPSEDESLVDTLCRTEKLAILRGRIEGLEIAIRYVQATIRDEAKDDAYTELSRKVSALASEIRGGFINLQQPRRSLADRLDSLVTPIKDAKE